jgi:hypothetical protein
VLSGKPHNFDDCFDLCCQQKLVSVTVTLHTPEVATEQYVLRRLIAQLHWEFESSTASVDESLGGCFMHEDLRRQRTSIDRANERLCHVIERIEGCGARVNGGELRFGYAVAYTKGAL